MINILIVDDKVENLYLLQSMFDTNCFRTIPANNGAEALNLMKQSIPDLIITDILMPVMDGFTLCRECKRDERLKKIPFFFYTATYTDEKDKEYALGLGADRFILKPQEPEEFVKIINDFLSDIRETKIQPKEIIDHPEALDLKEYNSVLIRKIEDKMLQTDKAEKQLRQYSETLEKEIIERKKNEESLRASQLQLSNALMAAHLGPWEYDVKNDTFIFNDLFYAIFNTSADKIGGYILKSEDYTRRFVHPDDIQMVRKEIVSAMSSVDPGYSKQLEHRFISPDGDVGYITVSFSTIKNERGETVKTYGVNQDITELRRMRDKIIESEVYYRTLFEGANDAILIMSGDTFVQCNEKTITMFGCNTKEDIINHHPWEFSPAVQPDGLNSKEKASELIKTILQGNSQRFYWKHSRKNGSLFDAEISLSSINIGKKSFIQALVTDISDRKKAEKELIIAKEKAEESDRLKTAFLHNISHEVRTPMNAIIGFSDLIGNPGLTPETRTDFIKIIVRSSNQLLAIINQIVTMATIEAGQEKIIETAISLNSVLRLVYEQFKPEAEKKNIALNYNTSLSENEDIIKTDEIKLAQIISNLLSNALKFTIQGSITFGYIIKGNYLEFHVKDTGIGIPEDIHKAIFERFRQGETNLNRGYEGAGLGLSISKAYVELMGGKIWLISKPQAGSEFYFNIPYKIMAD